jgi:hypothetical protein
MKNPYQFELPFEQRAKKLPSIYDYDIDEMREFISELQRKKKRKTFLLFFQTGKGIEPRTCNELPDNWFQEFVEYKTNPWHIKHWI